ncbi:MULTISPECIES: type II toxin-antitoxin system ParD family antitoxin [Clavibacter]|nr:type II toxin-antitoxin system ParD family antitoxin [Clavibacter michiganensis]
MAQDSLSGRDASLSRQVVSGRDRSAREVLRAALVVGEASGDAAPFDVEAFIAAKRA